MKSTESYQVKRKILYWSQKLSQNLSKPKQQFISDLLYGIQKSQSVILTDTARALEEKISLKDTFKRLNRQLNAFKDTDKLATNYQKFIAKSCANHSLVLVDDSDIIKPYGKQFECLKKIHDGSTQRVEKGYYTCNFSVVNKAYRHPIPIYNHLYSHSEQGFKSSNDETIKGFDNTKRLFGDKPFTYVMDRGYDRKILINYLSKTQAQFIIRLRDNRFLTAQNRTETVGMIANRRKGKLNFQAKIKGRPYDLRVSHIKVSFPNLPQEKMFMVVIYGFGKHPMKLLTNRQISSKQEVLEVVKSYLTRWRIEEQFRVIKQEYSLEKVRFFSLKSIRLIYKIVNILIGLISFDLNKDTFLSLLICERSKSLKDRSKVKFLLYRYIRGIAKILEGVANFRRRKAKGRCRQLSLW